MKKKTKKSKRFISEIDENPKFEGIAQLEDRSTMNVTFRLVDENDQEQFDKLCLKNGISGVNGHRSVVGYRASIYNALPIESVQALINTMKEL